MERRRKLCAIIALVLTLALCAPAFAAPSPTNAPTIQPGPPTDSALFEYELNGDGTIKITKFLGQDIADVVVPETIDGRTVAEIGQDAFVKIVGDPTASSDAFSRTDIKSVYFPDTVREIEDYALYFNEGLESVRLPDGLEEISEGLFLTCTSLSYVALPNSILQIEDEAFCGCESLESISIPDAVTSIGEGAFAACHALTSVRFPDGGATQRFTTINEALFAECTSLKDVTIPAGVRYIEGGAFEGCTALERIALPVSLRQIDELAFNDCPALRYVDYAGTSDEYDAIVIAGTEANCALKAPGIQISTTSGPTMPPGPTPTPSSGPTSGPTATPTLQPVPTPTPTASFAPIPGTEAELPQGITLVPDARIRVISSDDNNYAVGYVVAMNAAAATKADDLEDQFTDAEDIDDAVYSATGTEKDGDAVLGTGDVIRFARNGQPVFEATVVVQGDVVGNGVMSLTQLVRMANGYRGTQPLEGAYALAGDLNGSGTIDLSDVVRECSLLRG